jgi:excisionase family DNA binding protein
MIAATFLSERLLALRWCVSKTTVQRWRASGRLPFMRVGDVIRYRLADVERFEADHFHDAVVVGLKRPSPIRRRQ